MTMSDERWEILRKIPLATKAWYWTHDECVDIAAEMDRLREENATLKAERDALKMEVEVAISEIQKEGVKVSTLARMTGWRDDDIAALRAERAALKARLAEAEGWIARAVDYMEPYTVGDGPRGYITVQRARYDLSEMKRFLNPQPTAEGGE